MTLMKSLVKTHAKKGLELCDVPRPDYGPNDVLIRIKKTAICGTDIHIFNWDEWAQATIPVPMTVGHEFVGDIVKIGSAVEHFKVGDRVSGEGHITCGFCRNCRAGKSHICRNTVGVGVNRPGCFAEYLAIPASNVLLMPDDISDDMASILDPLGNATHTALSFKVVGEDVLITGAGPIGLMAAVIARHCGARHVVITDINDYRLTLARKLGVSHAINVSQDKIADVINDLGMTEGFDVGLEMSGCALTELLAHMNYGGYVALLGIPAKDTSVHWPDVIFKGLHLKGIYGREMFETWYKMIAMLQSGLAIEPVITHHFSVDDFQTGFETMASGQSGKVILDWQT